METPAGAARKPSENGTRFHLRGTLLPSGRHTELWIADGQVSAAPVEGAVTLVDGGYILPGLVDAHVHPGVTGIGEPLDEARLRADLGALARAGITAVRVPGSPARLPDWVRTEPGLPTVLSAGVAVAATDRFFPGWGRQCAPEEVPGAAAEEAAASGAWAKLIADWFDEDGGYAPSIPPDALAETARRVHAAGGRVAAHVQHEASGRAAVEAGIDSIEHGMHLPFDALPAMAEQGSALVPTMATFALLAPDMTGPGVPEAMARWFGSGWDRHPELVHRAYEAGVTVLAGTDLPVGALVEEIRRLHGAGLPAEAALAAASWTARDWLGLPAGTAEGAAADLIAVADDPREDLGTLADPLLVIANGHRIER